MIRKTAKLVICLAMALTLLMGLAMTAMAATTVTPVEGISVTDSIGNGTLSSGTVKITAKGGFLSKTTNTITIQNTLSTAAEISFDYSVNNQDSFTVAGASATSGTYKETLEADATVELKLVSKTLSQTATLTLSNFSITAAAASSNVTVNYNSAYGSVTAAGNAVNSGAVIKEVTSDGVALAATANSGYSFVGWINTATNEVVSDEASFTLYPTGDVSVKAIFGGASAAPVVFADEGDKLYDDLSAAATYAFGSTVSKVIILAADATLSESCTIPSGVTLQIPYNAANTLTTSKPTQIRYESSSNYVKPTAFRTLNMTGSASLTINGSVALCGQHTGSMPMNGMPCGASTFIKMAAGSKITVNSGANLYAWGFITGSGSVEVKSGGTVYEHFQVADFRGGDATTQLVNKADTYHIFPFTQYYVQNIEVPLTLHAGAVETGYFSAYITAAGMQGSPVPFIGSSDAMFTISSGYVVKDYLEGTGRLDVQIYGDVSVGNVNISMKMGFLNTVTIESANYALPLTNNLTVTAHSGNITLGQSVVMLPGSELYIEENATCTLGTGCSIYLYSYQDWIYTSGGVTCGYAGHTNKVYVQTKYVPGGDGVVGRTDDAMVCVNGTVDASGGYVHCTSGGANIYSTGNGVLKSQAVTGATLYAATQADTTPSYVEIATQHPILRDGGDTSIQAAAAGTYTYYPDTQKWCPPGHRYEAVVTAPTCTAGGYTTHTCIACGDSYTDAETAAIGHSYEATVIAPTCTEDGYTKHTCSVCGDSYTDTPVETTGHNYQETVVDPTCTTDGYTLHTCSGCGNSYKDNYITGEHSYGDWVITTQPGCETEGVQTRTCSACGGAETKSVAAVGHNYASAVTAPTCTAAGYTTYTCDNCGDSYVADEVAALGHSYDAVVTAPTCTEKGYTTYTCSACGDTYVADEVAALGHSYGDWVITKEATYTEEGSKEKTCSCGDVVTEAIPVLENPVETWNITLSDSIGVNFVTTLTSQDNITCAVAGEDVEVSLVDGKISIALAAAQMTDKIVLTVNGMELANTYSVRSYAEYILDENNSFSDKEKALVKEMLNYGAASQTLFGYNTQNLANAGITVDAQTPTGEAGVAYEGAVEGINFYGATLVHKDKIAVRFYFTATSIEGITFKANGVACDPVAKGDMYYIEVADINPQELNTDITVVVNGSLSVTYAPMDYIIRMYSKASSSDATKALVQALYGYYLAAVDYTG